MKKRKIIILYNLVTLILLICFAILNSYNNHYLSQEILFKIIGFIYALQFLGSLYITFYYFLKIYHDNYLGFTFLICFGINLLFLLVFFVWALGQMGTAMKGAITG